MRRGIAPVLGGRNDRAGRDSRSAARRGPLDPQIVAGGAGGRARRRGRAARQVSGCPVRKKGVALLIHLRMTGSLRHAPRGDLAEDSHTRAVISMDNGSDIAYRDVRRFGTWELFERGEVGPYLAARLGPEPLGASFSSVRLRGRLQGRRAPLKSALLDQRTLAGLGNIYVDEALWHSRLHPLRPAGSLGRTKCVACTGLCAGCFGSPSSGRDRRCATTPHRTARTARCRTSSVHTARARGQPAAAAAPPRLGAGAHRPVAITAERSTTSLRRR